MSQQTMRKHQGPDKKHKYRSDGTSIWTKPLVSGPGVWVSCVKGREKQAVGETYQLFESIASELWREDAQVRQDHCDGDEDDTADDIEAQVSRELASLKRPRKEQLFANCQTNTLCAVFISCKPPVDPVKLVLKQVNDVLDTGITQTRFVQRLTPVSVSCIANIAEIQAMCRKSFQTFFEVDNAGQKFSYKIELRFRNHTDMSRNMLIEEVARCLPEGHTVNLDDPEIFILIEVFKSVCGMSIVKDYYRLKKFNVVELARQHGEEHG